MRKRGNLPEFLLISATLSALVFAAKVGIIALVWGMVSP